MLDHSGTVKRLGFPTDDLPLELDDDTATTSGAKAPERKEPLPKACPSCKFMKPAKVQPVRNVALPPISNPMLSVVLVNWFR